MGQVTVGKWGDGLAVCLPDEVVRTAKLQDGERVDISAADGRIVIQRIAPRVTLEGLFQGKTPAEWRGAYAGAYDWGADVGREVVPE